MNLLLIDDTIMDIKIFTDSINDKTKYVIYNYNNTFEEITDKISELSVDVFEIIGFVFYDNHSNEQLFLEREYFKQSDKILDFIKNLIELYKIKIIDFLACNLLKYPSWNTYFALLDKLYSVKIRASNDRTGNLIMGGDWILETSNVNIKNIYFTDKILLWKNVLDFSGSTCINILTNDITKNLYISGRDYNGIDGTNSSFIKNLLNYSEINDKFINTKIINMDVGPANQIMIITDEIENNLYCAGNNTENMLGYSNNYNTFLFQNVCLSPLDKILLNKKIVKVSCGINHTGIIDSNNVLYMCGSGSNGQLGLGSKIKTSTFEIIDSLARISTNVNCGNLTTAVITNEPVDNLYTCGDNFYGQLGNGTITDQNEFQKLELNKKVINAKFGSYHLMIITNEIKNNLYMCGSNVIGQYGNNTIDDDKHPTFTNIIINNRFVSDIYAGQLSSIILTNEFINNMYVTGHNPSGSFGLNNVNTVRKFTRVRINQGITKFGYTLYSYSGMICTTNNKLYSAGDNNYGELGISQRYTSKFTEILFNKTINKIICGNGASFVLSNEHKNNLYVCGGDSNTTFGATNISIFNRTKFDKKILKSVVGGLNSNFITDEPYNNLYYSGYDTESSYSSSIINNKFTLYKSPNIYNKKVVDVSVGSFHCVILTNELQNNIYGIGYSSFGLPSSNMQYSFQNIGLSPSSNLYNKQIIKISCGSYFTHAIASDNKLYSTGSNESGQLGLGHQNNKTNFELAKTNVIDVAAGFQGTLILTNEESNNFYSCGCDVFGELGRNKGQYYIQPDFFPISLLPGSVIHNKKIINIYMGYYYSYIISSEASNNCYSSGCNDSGQLGLNNTLNRSTFTLVQNSLLNKTVTSANTYQSSVIVTTSEKTNNVYTCGSDNTGSLGLNNQNITGNTYQTTFQNISTFGDDVVRCTAYQFSKKIYLTVPVDIAIYSPTNADLNIIETSISLFPFQKSYLITPSLSTFDKHISFSVRPYTNSFRISIIVNSTEYIGTTDNTYVIYYKFEENIITVYTKMTGTVRIYYV